MFVQFSGPFVASGAARQLVAAKTTEPSSFADAGASSSFPSKDRTAQEVTSKRACSVPGSAAAARTVWAKRPGGPGVGPSAEEGLRMSRGDGCVVVGSGEPDSGSKVNVTSSSWEFEGVGGATEKD